MEQQLSFLFLLPTFLLNESILNQMVNHIMIESKIHDFSLLHTRLINKLKQDLALIS